MATSIISTDWTIFQNDINPITFRSELNDHVYSAQFNGKIVEIRSESFFMGTEDSIRDKLILGVEINCYTSDDLPNTGVILEIDLVESTFVELQKSRNYPFDYEVVFSHAAARL